MWSLSIPLYWHITSTHNSRHILHTWLNKNYRSPGMYLVAISITSLPTTRNLPHTLAINGSLTGQQTVFLTNKSFVGEFYPNVSEHYGWLEINSGYWNNQLLLYHLTTKPNPSISKHIISRYFWSNIKNTLDCNLQIYHYGLDGFGLGKNNAPSIGFINGITNVYWDNHVPGPFTTALSSLYSWY